MLARYRIVLSAAGALLIAGSALAQFPPVTDPNKDEQKCEKSAGTALTKFVGAKTKCAQKCIAAARKTMGPYGGCFGPGFTDPATNTCIKDPAKGAEVKAAAAIVKACTADCPECYDPSTCTDATSTNPLVAMTESQVDPFGNLIFCTEAGGGTPTKAAGKCEDTVAKSLVKFVGAKSKCYQKCNDAILKGKIAPGSCDPPTPSDSATSACIFDSAKGAEAKAAAAIDKVCEVSVNPKNEKPGCYATQVGSGWVSLVESNIDGTIPVIACGSPSGAFLN